MFRPLEAIIRSRSGYPKVGEEFGWQRCAIHVSCVILIPIYNVVLDVPTLLFYILHKKIRNSCDGQLTL